MRRGEGAAPRTVNAELITLGAILTKAVLRGELPAVDRHESHLAAHGGAHDRRVERGRGEPAPVRRHSALAPAHRVWSADRPAARGADGIDAGTISTGRGVRSSSPRQRAKSRRRRAVPLNRAGYHGFARAAGTARTPWPHLRLQVHSRRVQRRHAEGWADWRELSHAAPYVRHALPRSRWRHPHAAAVPGARQYRDHASVICTPPRSMGVRRIELLGESSSHQRESPSA